jgi:hypothetical protein
MAKAVADVLGAADVIGIDNAYNLVRHQSQLLTVLTGVPKPTEFHKTSIAEGLHTYRNVTVALVAAAAHFAGAPTDAVYRDSVTASAHGILDRMLAELGLANSDFTASSITLSPSGGSTRSGPTTASTSRCRCPDGTVRSRCWPSCSAPRAHAGAERGDGEVVPLTAPNQPKAATVTGGGLRPTR